MDMFFACGIWCVGAQLTFRVLDLRRSRTVCSDEGLTLEMSATHQIPQAKNIPYQPLLINIKYVENAPICSVSLL